jgi:hypothetical protein
LWRVDELRYSRGPQRFLLGWLCLVYLSSLSDIIVAVQLALRGEPTRAAITLCILFALPVCVGLSYLLAGGGGRCARQMMCMKMSLLGEPAASVLREYVSCREQGWEAGWEGQGKEKAGQLTALLDSALAVTPPAAVGKMKNLSVTPLFPFDDAGVAALAMAQLELEQQPQQPASTAAAVDGEELSSFPIDEPVPQPRGWFGLKAVMDRTAALAALGALVQTVFVLTTGPRFTAVLPTQRLSVTAALLCVSLTAWAHRVSLLGLHRVISGAAGCAPKLSKLEHEAYLTEQRHASVLFLVTAAEVSAHVLALALALASSLQVYVAPLLLAGWALKTLQFLRVSALPLDEDDLLAPLPDPSLAHAARCALLDSVLDAHSVPADRRFCRVQRAWCRADVLRVLLLLFVACGAAPVGLVPPLMPAPTPAPGVPYPAGQGGDPSATNSEAFRAQVRPPPLLPTR